MKDYYTVDEEGFLEGAGQCDEKSFNEFIGRDNFFEGEPPIEVPRRGLPESYRTTLIKQKAGLAINSIAPEWKQRNALARSLELTRIQLNRALTTEELAEVTAMEALWASIQAIRTASDAAEADGTLAEDFNP